MKTWQSLIGAAMPAACLALALGGAVPRALAADSAPPAPPSTAEQPGKFALPSAERPLVITITPKIPKALEELKNKAKPDVWSPQEIADAKARCTAILKKIHAVAVPEEPLKNGACGTPAPVQLISIGANPQVSLSPPATLSCDMAEALSQWVEGDLQPLARKHLGANLVRIEVMSSYSCRRAYGRKAAKLSEHGLANALDIRGFVTAAAGTALVLEDWGKPQREIIAEIKAAKAAEAKAAALKAERNQMAARPNGTGSAGAPPPAAADSNAGAPATGLARSTIADGLPKITVTIPGGKTEATLAPGIAFTEPSHLGGPLASPAKSIDKRGFLHEAHDAACRIFATTLGPEANASHRNHFHVDMAKRKVDIKICD